MQLYINFSTLTVCNMQLLMGVILNHNVVVTIQQ